jgi:hypothetical protein
VACLIPFAAAGCAPARGDVSGKVTYQGRPLVYGTVMFLGRDNLPVMGPIRPDGSYTVTGVLVGEAQVAVNSPDPLPAQRVDKRGRAMTSPVDRSQWFPIPEDYGDPRKSGLQCPVGRGQTPYDIDLK